MIYISLRVFIGTGRSGRENSEELSGVSGAVCVAADYTWSESEALLSEHTARHPPYKMRD